MITQMAEALKYKQHAEMEFNNAITDIEIDIAAHRLSAAEKNLSRVIILSKGRFNEETDNA